MCQQLRSCPAPGDSQVSQSVLQAPLTGPPAPPPRASRETKIPVSAHPHPPTRSVQNQARGLGVPTPAPPWPPRFTWCRAHCSVSDLRGSKLPPCSHSLSQNAPFQLTSPWGCGGGQNWVRAASLICQFGRREKENVTALLGAPGWVNACGVAAAVGPGQGTHQEAGKIKGVMSRGHLRPIKPTGSACDHCSQAAQTTCSSRRRHQPEALLELRCTGLRDAPRCPSPNPYYGERPSSCPKGLCRWD